jgi:hypothetical protein
VNKYILEGFFQELEKTAITRPAMEWYPFDHNEQGPMLHRTANSSMFTAEQYKPGALKNNYKNRNKNNKKEKEKDFDKDKGYGATDHAQEISDKTTARMISPEYRYFNPYK